MNTSRTMGLGLALLTLAGCGAPGDAAGPAATTSLAVTATSARKLPDFNHDGYSDLAVGVPDEDVTQSGQLIADVGAVNVIYGTAAGLAATNNQIFRQGLLGSSNVANDRFGAATAWGDFNRDGYSDLAVGIPGRNNYQGVVQVLYGSATGLRSDNTQRWSLGSAGTVGSPATYDEYGKSLAAGDFNGDGVTDLAVGIPNRTVTSAGGSYVAAGAVHVLYGNPGTGLVALNDQLWSKHSFASNLPSVASEYFGQALAAGDFDHDGRDDLAIGVPRYHAGGSPGGAEIGQVRVIYGASTGLSSAHTTEFTGLPDSFQIAGDAEMGASLAVGDFNGDGLADLAVGAPAATVSGHATAGCVMALTGHPNAGLLLAGAQSWVRSVPGLPGGPTNGALFGNGLAAGDFDNDGFDDLAIGSPGEAVGSSAHAGTVVILHGPSDIVDYYVRRPLTSDDAQLWHQGQAGVAGRADTDNRFGQTLVVGDFDGNGRADLSVGVPGASCLGDASVAGGGMVDVFYGTNYAGLGTVNNQGWAQGYHGLAGACEANDHLGGPLL